jgi:hypothetical protein
MNLYSAISWKVHRRFDARVVFDAGLGPVTDLLAGSTINVSWYLGYAHSVRSNDEYVLRIKYNKIKQNRSTDKTKHFSNKGFVIRSLNGSS